MTSILRARHVMNGTKEFAAFFRHDDDLRRSIDDPTHHVALDGRRLGEHRVKCRDDRHFEARQELDDIAAGLAAENSVFVLKGDNVEVAHCSEIRPPEHSRRSFRRESGSAPPADSHRCAPGSVMATTQVSRSGRAVETAR